MTLAVPAHTAPHLTRWVLPVGDRFAWIDAPPQWSPDDGPMPAMIPPRRPPAAPWLITSPTLGPDGVLVHELPWRPVLLAACLFGTGATGPADPAAAVRACHTLGRFARTLHDSNPDPVVEPGVEPTWVDRLGDPRSATLAGRAHWRAEIGDLRVGRGWLPVPVHGELRTDHVVVSADGAAIGPGLAILSLPGGPRCGDPALDMGSVLGDLIEVDLLGAGHTREAARAFRDAYADGRPLPEGFWSRTARYAALKVVDHELRMAISRGVPSSPRTLDRFEELAGAVQDAVVALDPAGCALDPAGCALDLAGPTAVVVAS